MKPGILSLVGLVGVLLACSAACGAMEEKPGSPGEAIFWDQCVMCHGRVGDLKMSGAKDLTKSALTKGEMIAIVTTAIEIVTRMVLMFVTVALILSKPWARATCDTVASSTDASDGAARRMDARNLIPSPSVGQ